jgi:hypothetical protein
MAFNQQYRTKAKGSKESAWLADKVLTIINNLYINLAVSNYYGVVRLFKDVTILVRIRVSGN